MEVPEQEDEGGGSIKIPPLLNKVPLTIFLSLWAEEALSVYVYNLNTFLIPIGFLFAHLFMVRI